MRVSEDHMVGMNEDCQRLSSRRTNADRASYIHVSIPALARQVLLCKSQALLLLCARRASFSCEPTKAATNATLPPRINFIIACRNSPTRDTFFSTGLPCAGRTGPLLWVFFPPPILHLAAPEPFFPSAQFISRAGNTRATDGLDSRQRSTIHRVHTEPTKYRDSP